MGWKKELFEINQIEQGIFSLSMKLGKNEKTFSDGQHAFTAPPVYQYKNDFLVELNSLGNLIEGPW